MPELVSAGNDGIGELVFPPDKFRCRFVFQGKAAGKSDHEKAVLDEFHNMQKMGAFKNLTMIHTPDEPCGAYNQPKLKYVYKASMLSLRYCGCAKPSELTSMIDVIDIARKKGKKIHVWPGCRKMANRTDAFRMNIHRYNGLGEDRAQIIYDNNLWCDECNPRNEVKPSLMAKYIGETE